MFIFLVKGCVIKQSIVPIQIHDELFRSQKWKTFWQFQPIEKIEWLERLRDFKCQEANYELVKACTDGHVIEEVERKYTDLNAKDVDGQT